MAGSLRPDRLHVLALACLCDYVERLTAIARLWDLTVGESLPSGIGALLVQARTGDEAEAVLKLSPTSSYNHYRRLDSGEGQSRANESQK